MARRLTTFSKLLITFLIVAALYFVGTYILGNTQFGQDLKEATGTESAEGTSNSTNSGAASNNSNSSGSSSSGTKSGRAGMDDKTLKVQLVSWGGYAPGLYFNQGAQANARSRFYKDYGFNVEFILDNDLNNALDAWIADCLLYTSPSPRDQRGSRMPSSA